VLRNATTSNLFLSSSTVTQEEALSALRTVYAELEQRPIQRACTLRTECCHFRITGRQPLVTQVEALWAARGVRASGKKKLSPHPDGACPCLGKNGRCTIYQHRPFGCRTHFCSAAGGPYTRREVQDLIQRLEALDESLGHHDGSRPFEPALDAALAQEEGKGKRKR
jgi:uncharacterized protein